MAEQAVQEQLAQEQLAKVMTVDLVRAAALGKAAEEEALVPLGELAILAFMVETAERERRIAFLDRLFATLAEEEAAVSLLGEPRRVAVALAR